MVNSLIIKIIKRVDLSSVLLLTYFIRYNCNNFQHQTPAMQISRVALSQGAISDISSITIVNDESGYQQVCKLCNSRAYAVSFSRRVLNTAIKYSY